MTLFDRIQNQQFSFQIIKTFIALLLHIFAIMNEFIAYGLKYKNFKWDQSVYVKIVRLLFLSFNNDVSGLYNFLNKINESDEEFLNENIAYLQEEVDFIKDYTAQYEENKTYIINKLQVWIDNLQPTPEEITEFLDFYNLYNDIKGKLRLIPCHKLIPLQVIVKDLNLGKIGEN